MFGEFDSIQGKKLTLIMDGDVDINRLQRFANGKHPVVEVSIPDGRQLSPEQRKKIFALIRDISEFTGFTKDETEIEMKYRYYAETGADSFSMSNCSMTTANQFLTFLLDFCFENNVPFKTKLWDSIQVDYHLTLQCLKYRKCIICGQHADIHHVDVLGNRKRDWADHRQFRMLPLCRKHHQEAENTPRDEFMQKYQVKGVQLPADLLISLHIMTRKQIEYWDERYAREGRPNYETVHSN